jgi:hypothetical protein
MFDAVYGGESNIISWAAERIRKDARSLPANASDIEAYMRTRGGALRVLYRSGTATRSRNICSSIRRLLAATPALAPWYRVEGTSVKHEYIPRRFGFQLLNAAQANVVGGRNACVPATSASQGSYLPRNTLAPYQGLPRKASNRAAVP